MCKGSGRELGGEGKHKGYISERREEKKKNRVQDRAFKREREMNIKTERKGVIPER